MLGDRGATQGAATHGGTSAAHQERSCSPHVARGTSSGSSSCDAGAACRNPVVHPRKQPGYAGQPAAEGSARGSKPASGTMVANRSAAVAAAACRRTLRGPYTGRPTLRPRRSPWRDEGPRVHWVLTRGSPTTITPSHRHTVFQIWSHTSALQRSWPPTLRVVTVVAREYQVVARGSPTTITPSHRHTVFQI